MANEYTSSIGTVDDGSIKDKAQQALSDVQQRAGEQIETRVTDQKTRAADKLSSVAHSLLTSSQQVRQEGNEDVGRYIERAADQVDRLANYLQRTDVHQFMDQVEGFARRQPAAFVAGAFGIGFLASRFLKSSRSELGYTGSSDRGRLSTFDTGNADVSRGYGSSAPRNVRYDQGTNWTNTGYEAAGSSPAGNRDIVGDPSVRTSVGLDTDSQRNRGDL